RFPGQRSEPLQGDSIQISEVQLKMCIAAPPTHKCPISFLTEFGANLRRFGDTADSADEVLVVAINKAAAAILDHFRQGAQIAHNHRRLARKGFDVDYPKSLDGD